MVSSQLGVAATGLLTTRFVEPVVRGQLTACLVWTSACFVFTSLSAPQSVVMRRGRSPNASLLRKRTYLSVATINLIAGAVTAAVLRKVLPLNEPLALTCIALLPAAMFHFEYASQTALASEGEGFSSLRSTQAIGYSVGALLAAVVTGQPGPVLLALLLSYVVAWTRKPAHLSQLAADDSGLWLWVKVNHPGLALAHFAGRLDLLIVTVGASAYQAGLYAAASAIPGLLAFLGYGVGVVLASRMHLPRRRAIYVKGQRGLVLLSLPIVFISAAAPGFVLRTLYSREYENGEAILFLLALATPFWLLCAYQSQILAAIDRGEVQTAAQAIAAIVLCSASVLAVFSGDLRIAAVGNILAYAVASVLQGVSLSRSL